MKMLWLALIAILFTVSSLKAQLKDDNCDERMTFCWSYPGISDPEVTARGNQWMSQDKTEKPLSMVVEIRCIRKLNVCIYASNEKRPFINGSITRIDLYNVTRWDGAEIDATSEVRFDPCEHDSLMLNHAEKRAYLIASPASKAGESVCTNLIGKPKTVVYQLNQ